MFSEFDVDQDGTLTTTELQKIEEFLDEPEVRELLDTVGVEQQLLKECIRVADIDGNGSVDKEELEKALESIHQPPTKADIRDLSQRILMRNTKVEEEITAVSKLLQEHVGLVDMKVDAIDHRLDRMEVLLTTLVKDKREQERWDRMEDLPSTAM